MLISRNGLLVALSLVISASARPAERRWGGWGGGSSGGHQWWQPSKASSYLDFAKRWGESYGQCNINNALGSMNLASGELMTYACVLEQLLIRNSIATSATTECGPATISSRHWSRNSELHLRPDQRNGNSGSYWCCCHTFQRQLHCGRHASAS